MPSFQVSYIQFLIQREDIQFCLLKIFKILSCFSLIDWDGKRWESEVFRRAIGFKFTTLAALDLSATVLTDKLIFSNALLLKMRVPQLMLAIQ